MTSDVIKIEYKHGKRADGEKIIYNLIRVAFFVKHAAICYVFGVTRHFALGNDH